MNRPALLLLCTWLLLITSCASPPSPSEGILHADDPKVVAAYKKRLEHVVAVAKATPNYERIPLDTEEEQNWFTTLTFKYWDGQITRSEFMQEGLSRFPDYKASLELVADELKK